MKKVILFFTALLFTLGVAGQSASQYPFTQSSGSFTAITGGTVLGTGTIDDNVYNANPIGFTFTFCGTAYTQFSVNANGWLCMGATAVSSYTPISTGTSNYVVSAVGRDLQGLTTGELRYQVLGTTPNQTLVVQWLHFQKYGSTGTGDDFSFQIRLNETSNTINIVYGSFVLNATSTTVEVGLRGASNADFNNRTTTTNWAATTAGATNNASCTLSNTVFPASGQTFTWSPPAPCAVPGAQPTALVLTPSTYSMGGSFTASPSADSYLVIRSLNSTLSATPVNGTVYPVGSAFGGGIVDAWGSATTFTSTGLTPNTLYYYFIFAANNVCIGSPPLYLTTSPLTGSQSTLQVYPISGTKTVGPTGDFFTLTAAFAYLNVNGVNGALNLVLQSTYISSVEPAFPIPVLPIPNSSSVNTVTVYPSATGLSVTSAGTTGTIYYNGANYVWFDGRVNATGSTPDLVIENTVTTGYSVGFANDASNNGIKYCIVKNVNTSLSTGSIAFLSTTGTTGNNNNVIDNCDLRDGATTPIYVVYSSGNTSPLLYNKNNTVSNCKIYDFYAAAGGNPLGIAIVGGSTGWTILGNSFYQTVPRSPTVANGYNVIFINSGDGYTISNNYIGGSAPLCGGTAWTLNGNGTPPTIANFIYAIRFQTGSLTANPSTVSGNTVANINLYTNPTAASIYFTGLISVVGIQNISSNVIGSATGTGSITISVGNGAYAPVYEGIDFRGRGGSVTNNTVGSIILQGPAGSTSTYALTYRAIGVTPTVQNSAITVSGNLVGSLTTAGSIQTPSATNPPIIFQGLYASTTGTEAMTVSNNTVANMSNPNSNTASYVLGLYDASSTVPLTVSGNTIRDLSTASTNTTLAGLASVVGLYSVNSVPGCIIRSNNIYNLANSAASAAVGINGMYLVHTAGTLLCEKNFIHNVSTASTSATSQVTGIYVNSAGTFVTLKNNMIQLGINADGSANTASSIINGILEAAAARDSVLNNSIYIGGAPAAVPTGSTYAFNSTIAPALTTPRVYRDNIFFNARSGGTTGKHYGIKIAGTTQFPVGLTSNYNMILANGGTGGTFGYFNSLDVPTFAAWKNTVGTDLASGNADPNFVAPAGNSSTANLHVQSPTPIEAAGIALANVTDDYDAQARSGLTPPDIGADAGNFTLSADVCGPNITYIPLGNGTVGPNRPLPNWATITDNVGVSTGASLPRIYYKKSTEANAFVGNTSANNGWKYVVASNSASPFSFTIDYSILTAPVVAGDIIQYFVVAQDAANNLSSWYPMAGASANPPVQNINAAPTNFQSYTIVANSIPTVINVPGTYPNLTGTGGAFDMINQGVLVGNTTINITADLVEPGTVALNAWAEDPPGSNYTLKIKPDATTLRTISGTAVLASGTGLIRTNGASRFTIDGQSGKLLTFRFTNATASGTGPTIQFNNGSVNDTVKNCTIENNGTSTTNGSCVNIGSTGINVIVISGNDLRDATAGTAGRQATGVYTGSATNSVKVTNNNIYNFINYGLYLSAVDNGAVITGNSFYYNSATASTAAQYCIYLVGSTNGHTVTGNYFGGQAPLCGGSPWTNTTTNSIYGLYGTCGIILPSTVSGNTVQNFNLSNVGSAYLYSIYLTAGVYTIQNNLIGSTTVTNSISSAGTGYFYGIYAAASGTAPTFIQGNTISGLNYTSTTSTGYLYLMYLTTGLFKVGTVAPNVMGSNTVAGSISYAGTGYIYGIYNSSGNPGNAIENNILGNWSLTGTSGSPYVRGMYIYSAETKKNKIFSISCTNAGLTPYIYGIYNYGASGVTNEYSNNFISLDGGVATNPVLYGFYDGSYTASYYNLYYNDFYVSGPATATSSTYAFYRSVAAFYTLRNNILANTRAAGGTGKHYAAYISSTGAWNANNNDLYSTAGPLGYYSTDQATMAAWKAATGGDAASQNADPAFVSSTDLHTSSPYLNNSGITIPAVTTDFSGAPRGNPPDIGLYEFSLLPVITTTAASGITGTGATLNGNALPNGNIGTTSFEYGLTIGYGTTVPGIPGTVSGGASQNFSASIGGLVPATLYHYRANGLFNTVMYNGLDMTFTTATIPPTVVTTAATAITYNSATLNGTVNANNSSTTVTFEYGLTTSYGNTVPGVPGTVTGTSPQGVLANIGGLLPNTLYHFRVNGVNAGGTANGNDMTFTTAPGPPTAVTTAATNVSSNSATLNGIITANGSSTTVTFEYGLTTAYGTTVPGVPGTVNSGNTPVPVTADISGLTINTTYHFRVNGQNGVGTTNGNDMTFLTTCPPPGPAGPISGPVSVCKGYSGYIYSVAPIPGAIVYNWTVPPGATITAGAGSTTIEVSYSLGASSGNVTVAGNSGCALGTPSSLAVTVNDLPTPTISGPATSCEGLTGVVYTTQSGQSNYAWAISAGGTITSGNGTSSITVTWNAAGAQNVSVNYANAAGCAALTPTVYPVTVNPAPTPTIFGDDNMCVNSGYYEYSTEPGYSNYTWVVSSGGVIVYNYGSLIQVNWIIAGAQWVQVNYSTAAGCYAPSPTVFNVTVDPLPGPAGTISGTSSACGGGTGSYYVSPIANATTYVWTLPYGFTITSGAGTNSITVSYAPDATSGNVTVYGNNLCGDGTVSPDFPVTITPLPADAGPITGQAAVCVGETGVIYSVAPIANATGYEWTLPAGATIVGGANTNEITVDFSQTAVSGVITVYGTNTCGNGIVSPDFDVTVNPIPPTPVITLNGYILTSDAPLGNQWYFNGSPIIGATGQTYDATLSGTGTYWTVVTLNGCSSDTSNNIYVIVVGTEDLQGGDVAIYPVPNDGQFTILVKGQSGNATLEIFNVLGTKVYENTKVVLTGTTKLSVDLRPASNGIYTVYLKNETNQVIRKILIRK
jgi:hypothetical protein